MRSFSSFLLSQVFGIVFFFIPFIGLQASLQADAIRVQEYAAFLNQNAKDDLHALYDSKMESDLTTIERQGAPGNYRYVASLENAMSPAMYINSESAAAFFSWEKNRESATSDSSSRNAECFNQVDAELRLNTPCSSPLESAASAPETFIDRVGKDLEMLFVLGVFCYFGGSCVPERACACWPRNSSNSDYINEGPENSMTGRLNKNGDKPITLQSVDQCAARARMEDQRTLLTNLEIHHGDVTKIKESTVTEKNNVATNLTATDPRSRTIAGFYNNLLSPSSLTADEKAMEAAIEKFFEIHVQAKSSYENAINFSADVYEDFKEAAQAALTEIEHKKIEIRNLAASLETKRKEMLATATTRYDAVLRTIPKKLPLNEADEDEDELSKFEEPATDGIHSNLQKAIEAVNITWDAYTYPEDNERREAFLQRQLEKQHDTVISTLKGNLRRSFGAYDKLNKEEKEICQSLLNSIDLKKFPFLTDTVQRLRANIGKN